jgi:type III secretory pathway component EscV
VCSKKGMEFSTAGTVYTVLTIGDGLMAAIPSLLITVSGGIIATRAASEKNPG